MALSTYTEMRTSASGQGLKSIYGNVGVFFEDRYGNESRSEWVGF